VVAHRQRLVRQRTQVRNRLHSVLHAHQLPPPAGRLGSPQQQAWWDTLDLPPLERLRVRQDLVLLYCRPLTASSPRALLNSGA